MTPPPARPTLKDVAAAAHVSISTVSYALNDRSQVKLAAETRARVRRVAKELGYTPNGIARSLQSRSSRTVGVVLSKPLTSPRYAEIVQGISIGLQEHDLRMAVLPDMTGGSFLADCRSGLLDGLIFVGHDDVEVPDTLAEAAADGTAPLVSIDCGPPAPGASYSSVDFAYGPGTELMLEHLEDRGITTILHLRPEVSSRAERERQAALMRSLGSGTSLKVVSTGLSDHDMDLVDQSPLAPRPHLRVQTERLSAALADVDVPAGQIAVLCSWGADVESALAVVRRRRPSATVAALAGGFPSLELWSELVYSALPLAEAGVRAAHLLASAISPEGGLEHLVLDPVLQLPSGSAP